MVDLKTQIAMLVTWVDAQSINNLQVFGLFFEGAQSPTIFIPFPEIEGGILFSQKIDLMLSLIHI